MKSTLNNSFSKLFVVFFFSTGIFAQPLSRPRLVIGIVVDQMRYDCLYRYYNKYSEKGFKRILNEGFSCENTRYNYVPTYTAPGHASIYTGTTPEHHGIVGNNWYNRTSGKSVYCTADSTVHAVGGDEKAGKMSPGNMLASNIADELKLATNGESKIIGLSLKDRASILPAGHAANAAYWFDATSGNMISSTWYIKTLPTWMETFNNRHLAAGYLKNTSETVLPIKQYTESTVDNVPWEEPFPKKPDPVFPYHLDSINKGFVAKGKDAYYLLKATPYGNTYTKEAAMAAIEGEQLGRGTATDMLCISFSSTDYVGHQFGPNSIETEDTYIRLDKDLGELIDYLDAKIGRKNYLLFLTADHGAAHAPGYLKSMHIPAGVFNEKALMGATTAFLNNAHGNAHWVDTCMNQQFYLNHKLMQNKGLSVNEMQEKLCGFLRNYTGIAKAVPAHTMEDGKFAGFVETHMQNGFNPGRSGDVLYALQPAWLEGYNKGTTHGESYPYDTHVPLLWLGYTIVQGRTSENIYITDIAATLAQLLKIQEPNACMGKPIRILCEGK